MIEFRSFIYNSNPKVISRKTRKQLNMVGYSEQTFDS
jgi:hypothetical protein